MKCFVVKTHPGNRVPDYLRCQQKKILRNNQRFFVNGGHLDALQLTPGFIRDVQVGNRFHRGSGIKYGILQPSPRSKAIFRKDLS